MNLIKNENLHNIFQKMILGDEKAIEELYKNYKNVVINIAFSIIKDKDSSEEISQMVFMKILKLEKSKLPTINEFSWIYTVTKNETIEYIRKQHNEIDLDAIYNIPNIQNEIDKTIDIEDFNRLIRCLDDVEKEIISLKIISNFTFKEISQILNIPIGTVQWRYYKAVHTLKIFIGNLLMFGITFLLYITSKENKNNFDDKIEHDAFEESMNNQINSGDIVIDSTTISGNKSEMSITQIKEIGLGSICTIFLVLTIIWAIILIKFQQKRKKKTSK